MIYILVFLLFIMIFFFYLLFDKNILSPTVIATGMFFVSSVIALLYIDKWKFVFSIHTTLIIITSLFSMGMGEFLVHAMNYKRNPYKKIIFKNEKPILIKSSYIIGLLIIFSALLIVYYKSTLVLAEEVGYKKGNGLLMLAYARTAVNNIDGKYSKRSGIARWTFTIIRSIAYVFSYIFLYNKIICKKKHIFIQLTPVILFTPYIVLSTGRTEFIHLITIWILIGSCFFMQKKGWNPYYTTKIIRIGILGIFIFLILFTIIGLLKSSHASKSALDVVAFYSGLSIPSLDYYFQNCPYPKNQIFGEHTLFGIYGILKKFIDIPRLYAPWEFVHFHGVSGNVYTVIRRYHQDYGYFGLYIIMFFLGFFYSLLFLRFKDSRKKVGLLVYALLFSPIVEVSIEERFLMEIIALPTIQSIFFIWIFFKIFVNNSIKNIKTVNK